MVKIAFGGSMGSGKDTAVNYLSFKFPQNTRLSFADAIYDILKFAQKKCGFNEIKDRKFLQFIGTEWGRDIDENVWINIVLNTHIPKNGFVSDVRFPNEFYALKNNGWICIKLLRDKQKDRIGTGDEKHSSETALDTIPDSDWDYIIDNNGTLEDLCSNLDNIIKMIK